MATMYNILLSIAKSFNDACKHRDLFLVLILLPLFFSTEGWAACRSTSINGFSLGRFDCYYGDCSKYNISSLRRCSDIMGFCNTSLCPSTKLISSYYYTSVVATPQNNQCQNTGNCYMPSGLNSFCYYNVSCDTQAEADSAKCVYNPSAEGCKLPDTTYTCQSVYTENNVIRSEIQMKVDGVPVGDPRYIIDGCTTNGFCEGESKDGHDSCIYRIDPSICDPLIEGCDSNDGQFKLRGITADSVCFYTCSKKDTNDVVYLTYGNQGAKGDDLYYGLRTVYPMVTTLDTIPLEGYEFVDSLLSAEVDVALYRGVKSGKYVYWNSNQPAPEGVKSIVRIR